MTNINDFEGKPDLDSMGPIESIGDLGLYMNQYFSDLSPEIEASLTWWFLDVTRVLEIWEDQLESYQIIAEELPEYMQDVLEEGIHNIMEKK